MLAAVGSFAVMDASMKQLAGDYSPAQVTAMRAAASLPFVLASVAWSGAWRDLVPRNYALHLLRGALGIAMLMSFIYALQRLSLADTYAIYMCAPLLVTALSLPLLGEAVPVRRWLAIVAGFTGVLVVLQPSGSGLTTLGGLIAAVSALCYALNVIAIRVLGRSESSRSMVFWFLVLLLVGAVLLGARGWQAIQAQHYGWIALIGLTGALGQYLITDAFRRATPSLVVPFEYTAIVWAVALDWVLWSRLPQARVLLGAAVVIAGGLYVLYDERRAAYALTAPPA